MEQQLNISTYAYCLFAQKIRDHIFSNTDDKKFRDIKIYLEFGQYYYLVENVVQILELTYFDLQKFKFVDNELITRNVFLETKSFEIKQLISHSGVLRITHILADSGRNLDHLFNPPK